MNSKAFLAAQNSTTELRSNEKQHSVKRFVSMHSRNVITRNHRPDDACEKNDSREKKLRVCITLHGAREHDRAAAAGYRQKLYTRRTTELCVSLSFAILRLKSRNDRDSRNLRSRLLLFKEFSMQLKRLCKRSRS